MSVGIQFWAAQGTVPRYDQGFPGIDHISCTLLLLLLSFL